MNQRYDLYGSGSTSPAITGNEEYVDPDTVRTFKNRALTSFPTNVEGKINILVSLGIPRNAIVADGGEIKLRKASDGSLVPYDEDRFTLNDVADFVGELPATVGGTAGAVAGGPPGAIAGGMTGDVVRQGISQSIESGEDFDPIQTGIEGVTSLVGDVVGAGISKVARGPLADKARSSVMGSYNRARQEVDKMLPGLNFDETVPIDAKTGSGFAIRSANIARTGPLSDEINIAEAPYFRKFEEAVDRFATKAGAVPRERGIEAGVKAKNAIEKSTAERLRERNKLYDEFEQAIDETALVEKVDLDEALSQIEKAEVFGFEPEGGATTGLNKLVSLMDQARRATSFADIRRIEQQAYNNIRDNKKEPLFSTGVISQLEILANSLHRTKMKFLESGGGTGNPKALEIGKRAASSAEDLFELNESNIVRSVVNNIDEKGSRLSNTLFTSTPEEIIQIKRALGAEKTARGSHDITKEGAEAWTGVIYDFFQNLKASSFNPSVDMKRGMFPRDLNRVISGQKMLTYLNNLEKDKPGALDAILGKQIHQDLRQVATILQETGSFEKSLANPSGTAAGVNFQEGYMKNIMRIIRGLVPGNQKELGQGLAGIAAKSLVDIGTRKILDPTDLMGRNIKKYLLGEQSFQKSPFNQSLLNVLGRGSGQLGVRSYDK